MANPRIPARRGHKHKDGDLEGNFNISGNWTFTGNVTMDDNTLRIESGVNGVDISHGTSNLVIEPDGVQDIAIRWNTYASGMPALGGDAGTPTGMVLGSDDANDQLGYALYSADGTRNPRAAFYLHNDAVPVFGINCSYSTGAPDFKMQWAGTTRFERDSSANRWAFRDTLRVWDGTDTLDFSISTSDAAVLTSSQHVRLTPAASHAVQVYKSGSQVYLDVFDSSGSDKMRFYHNGTDFYQTTTNATWVRRTVTAGSGFLNLGGPQERWYDSASDDSIRIRHNGSYGIIDLGNKVGGAGIRVVPTTSGNRSGIYMAQASAGDGTSTSVSVPHGGGLWFIVPSNTTIAQANDFAYGYWQSTTQCAVIWEKTTGVWSAGTGTNPNTAGDNNIWFTNGGQTLNLDNHRGSFRYYNIFIIGGDV